MNGQLANLAARHTRRPLLMAPLQAEELARRIQTVDGQAFARPSRLQAILRRLGGSMAPRPEATDDDDGGPPTPEAMAYAPYYAGEPEDLGLFWSLNGGVALMQVDTALSDRGEWFCGVFYHGYDTLLAAMDSALADERVKALFIRMSSPGGVVAGGLHQLGAFMREARAAAGGKPIWVYADMACSAAYWISAQADQIWAPRVGLVGSIGAVMVLENWAGALEKAGVEIVSIEAPEGGFKTEGGWWKSLTDEGRAALQAEIDQCLGDFTAEVELGRPALTPEKAMALRAAVFMAHHDDPARSGLALGLVDRIGTEAEAFAALKAEISGDPQSAPAPGPTSAAAGGSRRSPSSRSTKETRMARKATTPKGRAAAVRKAQAAVARAQAHLAQVRAESEAAGDEEDLADAEGDDEQLPAAEGEQDDEDLPGAESDDEEDVDAEDDEEQPSAASSRQAAARAIAGSPEAKTHPQLALTAIQTGQSLAQFRANVKAAGSGGGRNQLAATLGDSPRLGPDGGKEAAAPRAGAAASWARNRAAAVGRK